MKYRNMKSGEVREFPQGIKFDASMWKPIQVLRSTGRSTLMVAEIHPEDMKPDNNKTIMGEDKTAEKKSRKKSSMAKAIEKRNKQLAAAQEAEIVEESK